MAVTIIAEGTVCGDCANVIANGTGNGPILDDGREHYEAHAQDNMTAGDFVLSGPCAEEDGMVCLTRHDGTYRGYRGGWCPLSCSDGTEECLSCGTRDYGHRCAAVEFAR